MAINSSEQFLAGIIRQLESYNTGQNHHTFNDYAVIALRRMQTALTRNQGDADYKFRWHELAFLDSLFLLNFYMAEGTSYVHSAEQNANVEPNDQNSAAQLEYMTYCSTFYASMAERAPVPASNNPPINELYPLNDMNTARKRAPQIPPDLAQGAAAAINVNASVDLALSNAPTNLDPQIWEYVRTELDALRHLDGPTILNSGPEEYLWLPLCFLTRFALCSAQRKEYTIKSFLKFLNQNFYNHDFITAQVINFYVPPQRLPRYARGWDAFSLFGTVTKTMALPIAAALQGSTPLIDSRFIDRRTADWIGATLKVASGGAAAQVAGYTLQATLELLFTVWGQKIKKRLNPQQHSAGSTSFMTALKQKGIPWLVKTPFYYAIASGIQFLFIYTINTFTKTYGAEDLATNLAKASALCAILEAVLTTFGELTWDFITTHWAQLSALGTKEAHDLANHINEQVVRAAWGQSGRGDVAMEAVGGNDLTADEEGGEQMPLLPANPAVVTPPRGAMERLHKGLLWVLHGAMKTLQRALPTFAATYSLRVVMQADAPWYVSGRERGSALANPMVVLGGVALTGWLISFIALAFAWYILGERLFKLEPPKSRLNYRTIL